MKIAFVLSAFNDHDLRSIILHIDGTYKSLHDTKKAS